MDPASQHIRTLPTDPPFVILSIPVSSTPPDVNRLFAFITAPPMLPGHSGARYEVGAPMLWKPLPLSAMTPSLGSNWGVVHITLYTELQQAWPVQVMDGGEELARNTFHIGTAGPHGETDVVDVRRSKLPSHGAGHNNGNNGHR